MDQVHTLSIPVYCYPGLSEPSWSHTHKTRYLEKVNPTIGKLQIYYKRILLLNALSGFSLSLCWNSTDFTLQALYNWTSLITIRLYSCFLPTLLHTPSSQPLVLLTKPKALIWHYYNVEYVSFNIVIAQEPDH